MRRQLYGEDDDIKFFKWIQGQLKDTEKRLEEGRAVLFHLESQLMNVACDDPGAAIGVQLALPILQVSKVVQMCCWEMHSIWSCVTSTLGSVQRMAPESRALMGSTAVPWWTMKARLLAGMSCSRCAIQ